MTLLSRVVFLQRLKDELIERMNEPSTTYSELTTITKQMKAINLEIQEIKGSVYRQSHR
jgi:hypothetical protein